MARLGRAFPSHARWIRPVQTPAGPAVFPSTPSGSTTPVGTLSRTVTKATVGSTTPAGTALRVDTKIFAGTSTPAAVVVNRPNKIVAGSSTPTGTIATITQRIKSLAGSITPTGTAAKQANKIVAGSSTPAGTVLKAPRKIVAGSSTPTGTVVKPSTTKVLSGSATPSGLMSTITQRIKSLAGSITPSGTALRQANKITAGSSTPTGTVARRTSKLLAGSTTPSGTKIHKFFKALSGSFTPSGTILMYTARARILAGSLSPTGGLLRTASKAVTGSSTPTASVARSRINKLLVGSSTPSGAVARSRINKLLVGSTTPTGIINRITTRIRSSTGSITPTGVALKRANKKNAGSITPTGSLLHRANKVLGGAISLAGDLLKSFYVRIYGPAGTATLKVALAGEAEMTVYQRNQALLVAHTVADALGAGDWARTGTGAPVRAAVAPDSPTGVVAEPGNTQASVSFIVPSYDGGSPIIDYTATASTGQTATSTYSPIVVPGLLNGTTVSFIVTARNIIGDSIPSDVSAPVTPVAGVPEAPTAVVATPQNGAISVSWTAPVNNGGSAITSYTLNLSNGTTITGVASSPRVVSGLTNGVPVSVTVSAVNVAGSSEPSVRSADATPRTVPDAPTITGLVASSGQVTVQWSVPGYNGGSPLLDYTVVAYSGTGSTVVKTQTGVTGTSYAVTGLTNSQAYSFTVAARNAAGTGAASTRSATATPIGATIGIRGATAAQVSSTTSLTLTRPTGSLTGDYMIATVTTDGPAPVTTVPTGWTQVAHVAIGTSSHVYAYSRFVTDSTTTWKWLWAGNYGGGGGIVTYSGVHATTPLDGTAVTAFDPSTSATFIEAALTSTSASGMLVAALGADSTSISFTPPSGWVEEYDSHASGGRVNSQAHYSTTGASSGTYRWTASAGRTLGLILFALRHA